MLAPTGTIAFLMDCDTTGIEPDIALVKYKAAGRRRHAEDRQPHRAGRLAPAGLQRPSKLQRIIAHIEKFDTIEDVEENGTKRCAAGLSRSTCRCLTAPSSRIRGKRSISYLAHLKMMGAAQPFISGAISKTVNMPNESTVEDIRDAYVQAWKMGLKCVAIYRDGSKRSQPLNTKRTNEGGDKVAVAGNLRTRDAHQGTRSRSRPACASKPASRCAAASRDTRTAITHKFDIAGHEGYLTVGLFENSQPGELFITMAKEGSTIGGLMDGIGTLTSLALQYGVPLEALVRKFAHVRFEPSGFTKNPEIRNAASITDYVFRWMASSSSRVIARRILTEPQPAGAGHPGPCEEVRKKVNRPVPELAISEDTEIEERGSRSGQSPRSISERALARHGENPERLRRPFPAGRAHLPELRPCRRAQRRLLQMPELRREPRLLLISRQCTRRAARRLLAFRPVLFYGRAACASAPG